MKSKRISIKKNFLYTITYEVFRLIVPLITTPYVSRILGAEGIGTYALSFTFSQYFILFAGLGFSTYAARELAYVRDDREKFHCIFIEIFMIRVFLLSIAILIYIACFYSGNEYLDFSYKISIIYLVASIFDISYYFKAIENFKTVAIRNIFVKFTGMILIFCTVKNSTQVWIYTLILSMAELIGQILMVFSVEKSMWKMTSIRMNRIKKHFCGSLSLFIPTLAIQMYTMLDKVMIGLLCGEIETGYYDNAQKMIRLAATVSSSIVVVLVPRMSYYFAKRLDDKCAEYYEKVFTVVSFFVFPLCFGLIGVADGFSNWYFGANFIGIQSLIILGSPIIISLGWSSILGNMILISSGNQKYYTIAVYIGAILNIFINLLLIPRFGAHGAMLGSLIAEFAGMFMMLFLCNKNFGYKLPKRNIFHYLICSIIMLFILRILAYLEINNTMIGTCLEIIIGGSTYCGGLFVLKDSLVFEVINGLEKNKKYNSNRT